MSESERASEVQSVVSEVAPVSVPPATARTCFESAARVLRFAETEDHPARFEQYLSLAERWMELGSVLGGE